MRLSGPFLIFFLVLFLKHGEADEAIQIPSVWKKAAPVPRPSDDRLTTWRNTRLFRSVGNVGLHDAADTLFVKSTHVAVALSKKHGGIISIVKPQSGTEFISQVPERPILWEIEFMTGDGKTITWSSVEAKGLEFAYSPLDAGLAVSCTWPLQHIAEETEGQVSVHVQAVITPDSPRTRWRISVDNRLENAGLWQIRFPVIDGLGYAGASDVVAGQQFFKKLDEEVTGQLWSLQFVPVTCGDATLYLGAEDAAHSVKSYRFRPGGRFLMEVLPSHASEFGKGYRQEFDFVIAPIAGDWFDAAMLYRIWAHQQEWCKVVPLAIERRTAGNLDQICLWLVALHPMNRDPEAVVDFALKAKMFFDVPLGIHWYGWSRGPGVAPKLAPARDGFDEAVKRAAADGIPVMPYVSVLYSIRNRKGDEDVLPGFARLSSAACRPLPGSVIGRTWNGCYLVGVQQWWMVPMCRCTAAWQDCIADAVRYLHDECGVRAVYLDMAQVACRWPCFAADHGHIPGGGSYWAEGTITMLEKIRSAVQDDITLSGEGRCEAFIPHFDMDLIGYWPEGNNCPPIYEAVYADRRLSFASLLQGDGTRATIVKAGMRFLQGAQLRIGAWILDKEHRASAEFIRRLLAMKNSSHEFLTDGELLRAPEWLEEPPRITCPQWLMRKRGDHACVSCPAMERAAWRSPDGRDGVFIVNFDDRPHTAELRCWDKKRISCQIPPRDVKLIVLE